MTTKADDLYAALGRAAVTFSNLEHNVRRTLDIFVGSKVAGPILLDLFPLARIIDGIRIYAKVRLDDGDPLQQEVLDIIGTVDKSRVERNVFVHGQWVFDPSIVPTGKVDCFDYKLKYNKQKGSWEHLHVHRYTTKELAERATAIGDLRDRVVKVNEKIEAKFGP